jgi:hypothetical protein
LSLGVLPGSPGPVCDVVARSNGVLQVIYILPLIFISPETTSALIHIFVFGWATEWVAFVVELVAAFAF